MLSIELPEPPQVHPIPDHPIGLRLRLELDHTEPTVWRLIDLPGALTLEQTHEVIQEAMGLDQQPPASLLSRRQFWLALLPDCLRSGRGRRGDRGGRRTPRSGAASHRRHPHL